jgi:TRAP-type mannitol/chloroaromatic compound transport system substrate-binding protein
MKAKKPGAHGKARRRFLANVAGLAGGAAALAMPSVSRAQTINWRFQSTWPAKDIFHEFAQDYVRRVNEMAGRRFRIELLPSGAVVNAFQVLDATNIGVLDGAHGVTVYASGKHPAVSLFGTAAPLGWDANQLLGWFYYGGGEALYQELIQGILKLDVVGMLSGPMPTQPLGWFKKPIERPEDMRGLKFRTVGLSAELFEKLGVSVRSVASGEIVPAMERNVLDGAEFNNPSSDLALGFPAIAKVYMLGSYHQRVESFEIIHNKTKYEALPGEIRAVLRCAAEAASADMSWKQQDRYATDMEAIRKAGVQVVKTPDAVLKAQLDAWSKLIEQHSADPFFKKVFDSQKDWVKRVVGFYRAYETPNDMAWKHFFS